LKEQDFIRQAASELAPEFGPELVAEIELRLRGGFPRGELTRSIDVADSLRVAADFSVIAHFMITVAPTIRAKLRSLSDRTMVRRAVMRAIPRPASLKEDVTDRIVDKLIEKASQELDRLTKEASRE
jgi:hypothetical protein